MRTSLLRISLGIAVVAGGVLLANGLAGARPPSAISPPQAQATPYRPKTPPGVPTAEAEYSFADSGSLGATNRDRLRVCVQSLSPEVDNATVQRSVAGVLPQVRAHPDYKTKGLNVKPPSVEVGCPGTPMLDRPGFRGMEANMINYVKEASPYQVYIYVAPAERLATITFVSSDEDLGYRAVDREHQRTRPEAHTFAPVSTEVYFTPMELADSARLVRSIQWALKLEPLDLREKRLEKDKAEKEKADQLRAKPPRLRVQAGSAPVLLRIKADSDSGSVELAPGTILVQTALEVVSPDGVRWLPVQDAQGRQGIVCADQVVPVS